MKTIIFSRHGQTFGNLSNKDALVYPQYSYQYFEYLTCRGMDEARNLGHILHQMGVEFDEVYTSNMIRSQITAQIALETARIDKPVHWMPEFDEWDNKSDYEVLFASQVKPGLDQAMNSKADSALVVTHYHTMDTMFRLLGVEKIYEWTSRKHIPNATPFIYNVGMNIMAPLAMKHKAIEHGNG